MAPSSGGKTGPGGVRAAEGLRHQRPPRGRAPIAALRCPRGPHPPSRACHLASGYRQVGGGQSAPLLMVEQHQSSGDASVSRCTPGASEERPKAPCHLIGGEGPPVGGQSQRIGASAQPTKSAGSEGRGTLRRCRPCARNPIRAHRVPEQRPEEGPLRNQRPGHRTAATMRSTRTRPPAPHLRHRHAQGFQRAAGGLGVIPHRLGVRARTAWLTRSTSLRILRSSADSPWSSGSTLSPESFDPRERRGSDGLRARPNRWRNSNALFFPRLLKRGCSRSISSASNRLASAADVTAHTWRGSSGAIFFKSTCCLSKSLPIPRSLIPIYNGSPSRKAR